MKTYYVEVMTDGVVKLQSRKATRNETSVFYVLDDEISGSDKWDEVDGLTAWRKGSFVELLISIRTENDELVTLGTLPPDFRPSRKIVVPVPQNSTGIDGTISKPIIKSLTLNGITGTTSLPDNVGVIGTKKTRVSLSATFDTALAYDAYVDFSDKDGVSIFDSGAEGGAWTKYTSSTAIPVPIPAGNRSRTGLYFGYTNFLDPGEYIILATLTGAGYEDTVEIPYMVWPFAIKTLTVSYSSDASGFDLADGDNASFTFFIEITSDAPQDCPVDVYYGDTLIMHEDEGIWEGDTASAYYTLYAKEFLNGVQWGSTGNKIVRFVITCGESKITKEATVKVVNGGK